LVAALHPATHPPSPPHTIAGAAGSHRVSSVQPSSATHRPVAPLHANPVAQPSSGLHPAMHAPAWQILNGAPHSMSDVQGAHFRVVASHALPFFDSMHSAWVLHPRHRPFVSSQISFDAHWLPPAAHPGTHAPALHTNPA
jgi:hypothetical protein